MRRILMLTGWCLNPKVRQLPMILQEGLLWSMRINEYLNLKEYLNIIFAILKYHLLLLTVEWVKSWENCAHTQFHAVWCQTRPWTCSPALPLRSLVLYYVCIWKVGFCVKPACLSFDVPSSSVCRWNYYPVGAVFLFEAQCQHFSFCGLSGISLAASASTNFLGTNKESLKKHV